MIRLLFFISLTSFTLNLGAQVPHEWYLGKGKVMKFTMYGGMQIEDDTTVMEDFSQGQHFQILDENDSVSEILYENLVWEKTPNGFVKTKLGDDNNNYKCLDARSNLKLYEKFEIEQYVTQSLVLIDSDDYPFVIDTMSFSRRFNLETAKIIKLESNVTVLSVSYFSKELLPIIRSYYLNGTKVVNIENDTLLMNNGMNRQFIPGMSIKFLDSNSYVIKVSTFKDTLGSDRWELYTFLLNYKGQNLQIKQYNKIKSTKWTNLDGSFYGWGYAFFNSNPLGYSTNDSTLFTINNSTKWVESTNSSDNKYNALVYSKKSKVKSVSSLDLVVQDSTKELSIYSRSFSNFIKSNRSPDNKLYSHCRLENDSPGLLVIKDKKESKQLEQQIEIIETPELNVFNNLKMPLPNFNKSYKRLEFRKARECSPKLRLFAFADNYYDSFEWHVANDTGGYDIHYGKNLVYDAPGKNKFYVILKGIHTKTGYFAWNADSVLFNTSPKADFVADTNKWCQYVELKLKDNSILVDGLKHEYEWTVYKDEKVERTLFSQNPTIKFQQTGDYDIQLTVSNATCSDSIKKSAVINIIEAPKPGFNLSDTLICAPDSLHIKSAAQGRISSLKYFVNTSADSIYTPDFSFEIIDTSKIIIKQVLLGPTGCVTQIDTHLNIRKGFAPNAIAPLTSVSVIDSSLIRIIWDSFPNAENYQLFRDDTLVFKGSDNYFLDSQKNTSNSIYNYYLNAIDACNKESENSPAMNNMVLRVQNQNNEAAILKWSPYIGWSNGVSNYVIEE